MKIGVCIKIVPDPAYYGSITLDPVKKTLVRDGIPSVIDPTDTRAIELALQWKDRFGAEVILFSMAPDSAQPLLREGLAIGADRAYLLSDRRVAGADTLSTSYILSRLIQSTEPCDLILCGNESSDGATSHVPAQLGEWMNMPHASSVVELLPDGDGSVQVKKKLEDCCELCRLTLPSVVAIKSVDLTLRYATMPGIKAAMEKEICILRVNDLADADNAYLGLAGSPTQPGELRTVDDGRAGEVFCGSAEEAAAAILEKIAPYIGMERVGR